MPDVLFAAVMVVGHARTLVWDIVCDNIKTRPLDGLAAPPSDTSSQRWQVDLFLFLSLDDADSRKDRLKQSHDEKMLEKCIKKLKPVYVDFMPPTYEPPKEHGCGKGTNQPDAVYLKIVPPLWQTGGISAITLSAGALGDAYTFVPRGCRVAVPECIGCADTAPTRCTNQSMMERRFDPKVDPVLARANTREFFDQNHLKLPSEQRSRKDHFGWLYLECERWKRVVQNRTPELWRGDELCKAEAKTFLRAQPPADPDG
eukprot:Skav219458  [mRNA]  locus=scaffold2583:66177:67102:+ [translate_table: standard]